jgi:glycosyltransferase involved in cell wall biosynthesis
LKIGLVTLYFPPLVRGGAHLSAYYITKGLAERGHDVHVFTAAADDHYTETNTWGHPDVHRHPIFPIAKPNTAWGQDYASLLMGRYLRRYLRQKHLRLDVLHAYGMDTIPAVVLSRRYGRAVATFNGYWATCPFWDHTDPETRALSAVCGYKHLGSCVAKRSGRGSLWRRLAKWHYLYLSLHIRRRFAQQLDLILPISQSMRVILTDNRFPADRMKVCYNMVDLGEYQELDQTYLHRRFGLEQSCRILLHAGRFAPYKGTEYILKAVPSILACHSNVQFVFVGQGANLPALKDLAQTMGIGKNVTLGGFIDPHEMPHAYASAYALLHTATWPEPFARGPVEAMAAGTAVVGTATGGTPEVVVDGKTGLLIPPFDTQAIAEAVKRLLRSPALRDRLGTQGQALVRERFSIAGQIGCYEAAYASVL